MGLSLIYGKKKDQSALQLTGIQEAGLEGFEPPTHGPGNRCQPTEITDSRYVLPAKPLDSLGSTSGSTGPTAP